VTNDRLYHIDKKFASEVTSELEKSIQVRGCANDPGDTYKPECSHMVENQACTGVEPFSSH